MRRIRINKKVRRVWRCVLAVAVLLALTWQANRTVKPVAEALMSTQGSIMCNLAVNNALVEVLSSENVEYSKLVTLVYNESGNVVAIETNTTEINRLNALLTNRVNVALSELPESDVRIAVGTLTGWQWLSGRGPRIALRMVPSSYAESRLVNRFDSTGINQTRHQIMVEFTINLTVILAPYRCSLSVPADVCIAETVIVGTVPQAYADFE